MPALNTKEKGMLKPLDRTGGSGFEDKRLIKSAEKIAVKSTEKEQVARFLTAVFGIILAGYGLFAFMSGEGMASLGLAVIGAVAVYAAQFVKRKKPLSISLVAGSEDESASVSVKDIDVIEFIKKYIALPDVSDTTVDGFDCYEVNIRMVSGERFSLLNHGHLPSIERDIRILQRTLRKEVVTGEGCVWPPESE